MNKRIIEAVKNEFQDRFQNTPLLVRAPGRINLIGEHTDYNLGFVLPAAVGQSIYFAVGPSSDPGKCQLVSLDQQETYDFQLSDLAPVPNGGWRNYILGVVAEIQKAGKKVPGFSLVFSGDVPQGSGMSSSAALECGTCFAINELFGLGLEKVEMVKMAQQAEHNYAGVKCGIMDQFASMMGHKDQALLLDCNSLEYHHFPVHLSNYSLVLCNSNVSHNLASSEYNVRRQQCEEGVSILQQRYPAVKSMRDASLEQLQAVKAEMPEVVYRRCKYVIEENGRVHAMTEALEQDDFKKVGNILRTAQLAMQHEYEITCPEIDFMADFATEHQDVIGSRMMGGGFGGCTINLVKKGAEKSFEAALNEAYLEKFQKEITPVEIDVSEGVRIIN